MNIQHSSASSKWGTPASIIDLVNTVLGTIDLDPCSSTEFNRIVNATRFIDEEENGLSDIPWTNANQPISVFVNPPAGKYQGKSMPIAFWKKLLRTPITHAIFLGFSLEQLPQSQDCAISFYDYPTLIPRKRIKFDSPNEGERTSPTHSNFITYVPRTIDKTGLFLETFSSLGEFIQTLT